MNKFGGNWTETKIEILVEYAGAYLTIMNVHAPKYNWKLMYFDGFAGSGLIIKGQDENRKEIVGAARRIIEIDQPCSFDEYYFVELDKENVEDLKASTQLAFPEKRNRIFITQEDCNVKLKRMAEFLHSNKGKKHKILAYIDPCGMQLKWDSIEQLKDLSVDIWILVPTGLGVNRLLKKDGNISDAWLQKLENFLGMGRDEIRDYFYKDYEVPTLFGPERKITKEEKAIERSAELYRSRLLDVFSFVSDTYTLKTDNNTTLFHFLMASKNEKAINIANEIIGKYNKKG